MIRRARVFCLSAARLLPTLRDVAVLCHIGAAPFDQNALSAQPSGLFDGRLWISFSQQQGPILPHDSPPWDIFRAPGNPAADEQAADRWVQCAPDVSVPSNASNRNFPYHVPQSGRSSVLQSTAPDSKRNARIVALMGDPNRFSNSAASRASSFSTETSRSAMRARTCGFP